MLLCVDGVDPDLVTEYGWNGLFNWNYSLKIPKECFVPDPELGSTPHTTRVWPTIFTGQKIDWGLTKRVGFRSWAHDALVRWGITWKRGKPRFKVAPVNRGMDTIFKHYTSFHWNIPTISPEWIATFPGYSAFVKYCKREFLMWQLMTKGSIEGTFDVDAYYFRYLDFVGHNDWKSLRQAYTNIFLHIHQLKKHRKDVVVISDHGCKEGLHTNYAYLGSDYPLNIHSVVDIRKALEEQLDGPLDCGFIAKQ